MAHWALHIIHIHCFTPLMFTCRRLNRLPIHACNSRFATFFNFLNVAVPHISFLSFFSPSLLLLRSYFSSSLFIRLFLLFFSLTLLLFLFSLLSSSSLSFPLHGVSSIRRDRRIGKWWHEQWWFPASSLRPATLRSRTVPQVIQRQDRW